MSLFSRREAKLLSGLKEHVAKVHPQKVNLTNNIQFFSGENVLGYPALGHIKKDGKDIGWAHNNLNRNGATMPFLQVNTDIDKNIPLIFSEFKPEIIVDFGTASGGSTVFYYELAQKYCSPQILTIDISDNDVERAGVFHDRYKTWDKVKSLFGKSTLDCKQEVSSFIAQRKPGQKVLFSFDDDHSYQHTYNELCAFAPMLQSGDVILMQDTWDQGFYGHETSPMLAVERFLEENKDTYQLASNFLGKLELPCNFIYGVLIKK